MHDLLAQSPYSPGASFTDLGRALSRADSDILGRATRTLSQISGGVARVQGNEIASGASSTFAQALGPFASTFPNVLTAFADFLPRAGLRLLLLVLLDGLRLGSPLILRRMRWLRKCRR